jgi:hypothetical protein
MKIFKYPLAIVHEQTIEMPKHSKILCVQMQGGVLCLWAAVNPDALMEKRIISIVGTGNPTSVNLDGYIGTVQQGYYVWHIFEGRQ